MEWLQAHGWSVVAATTAEDLLASATVRLPLT
jgi:hypothetical protein